MSVTHRPGGSLRFARVLGVDVYVHWTFFILLLLVWWASADPWQFGTWLLWLIAVFASVLGHELCHCLVARRRGAVVHDILLLPIGGLSQLERMPARPADEFAVAAAGPLASVLFGAAASAIGAAAGATLWPPTLFAGSWFARVAWLNFLLAGFNLLPALPMDGGRMLRSALVRRHGREGATGIAGRVARAIAAVLAVAGVLYDFWLLVIAVFVFLGATAEEEEAARRRDQRGGAHTGAAGAAGATGDGAGSRPRTGGTGGEERHRRAPRGGTARHEPDREPHPTLSSSSCRQPVCRGPQRPRARRHQAPRRAHAQKPAPRSA